LWASKILGFLFGTLQEKRHFSKIRFATLLANFTRKLTEVANRARQKCSTLAANQSSLYCARPRFEGHLLHGCKAARREASAAHLRAWSPARGGSAIPGPDQEAGHGAPV